MGILGFAAAYVCSNWGIAHSTATNAALLITVEPVAMILLSPWYLGERLSRRGAVGAALTIVGTVILVVDGIPGVTERLVPHWAGDLVLVLAGGEGSRLSVLVMIALWVVRNPGFILPGLKWLGRKIWRMRRDLILARGRLTKLSFLIHDFMGACQLEKERVDACAFMVATAEGPPLPPR